MKFVKLDLMTIKPFLVNKSGFVMLILFLFLTTFSAGAGSLFAYMIFMYPFALGEKNNLNALYVTLGVPRKTVVLGRFAFVLLLNAAGGVISVIFSYLISIIRGREFAVAEVFLLSAVLFFVFLLLECFQMPFFFKLPYSKSKFISVVPLIIIMGFVGVVAGSASSYFENGGGGDSTVNVGVSGNAENFLYGLFEPIMEAKLLAATAAVVVLVVVVFVSVRISISVYAKREL
jgi:hypothetical protein